MSHIAIAESVHENHDYEREFEVLFNRHYAQAYNIAYRLTGNAADAEDLVQEAFLRAFRSFSRYDRSMPFLNWLNRILVNQYIDTYRRRKRMRTVSIEETYTTEDGEEGPALDIPDTVANPLEQALANEAVELVMKALDQLAPEFRTAVVLADVEGYSYEEIAEVMGTSIGTVRSRIHRGRNQIREYLQKHHPDLFQRGDLK